MIHSGRRPPGGAAHPPSCSRLARSWAGSMPLTRGRPPGYRRNTCATARTTCSGSRPASGDPRLEPHPRPAANPAEDLRTPPLRAGHPAPHPSGAAHTGMSRRMKLLL